MILLWGGELRALHSYAIDNYEYEFILIESGWLCSGGVQWKCQQNGNSESIKKKI